jgi:hypothetical protein
MVMIEFKGEAETTPKLEEMVMIIFRGMRVTTT